MDALGNPVAIQLTPGQPHDIGPALSLLEHVEPAALLQDEAMPPTCRFCKSKQHSAVSTHYDKIATTFPVAIVLNCTLLWLN